MDDAERRRRIVTAYNMAVSELRARHHDEFEMLNEFYREYLQVSRTRQRYPKRPPAPTSTRKGKQRQQ